MKIVHNVIAAAAAAVLFTGCASMQSGTTQEIEVNSNPAGATVYVGNYPSGDKTGMVNRVAMGKTPAKVRISRKDGAIALEKDGYQPVLLPLTTKMNPWVWGDILLTSPLSTSIDSSTGAINEFDPGQFMIELKAVGAK